MKSNQIGDPPLSKLRSDDHGTKWIILDKSPFQDLVKSVHDVSAAISGQKSGDRMFAAIFKGQFKKEESYWVCNYRTSNFHPFIPEKNGSNKDESILPVFRNRNHKKKIELGELFRSSGLPVEAPENWFALWDAPF